MKKVLLFVFFSCLSYSQDMKQRDIEEVVVKSKPKITILLKKLNNQLLKKTDTTGFVFNLRQINLKNTDTVINRFEEQILKITNYNGAFLKKNVIENKNNWFSNFKTTFAAYDAKESPIGWLSGYPIRKNITVAELDFFAHPKNYVYTREWLENKLLLVTFVSKRFYKGSFIVDENFNLMQLNYETQEPYPFFYSSEESVGRNHKFTSNWIYQKEKVAMSFEIIKGKIILKQLYIEEKLRDFTFKRFDDKGTTFTDVNNFYTNIKLENKNYLEEVEE